MQEQATQAAAAYLEVFERERESYLLGWEFSIHVARHPELRRKFEKRYRESRESYARLIEEYAAVSGLILPLPSSEMVLIYFALVDGLAMAKIRQPDAIPDDLFAKALALIAGSSTETGGA